jgi:exopolyphosphatase/guanosine-5'-triphosphate,3'-diphosphate pyrophosphatase
MFDFVLSAPFAAINHAERAFLAGAIHYRYTKADPMHAPAFERLLTDEQRNASAALGAALRLGADVSGRAPAILEDFALGLVSSKLTLSYKANRAHLVTELASKRLEPLAKILGVEAQLLSGLRR